MDALATWVFFGYLRRSTGGALAEVKRTIDAMDLEGLGTPYPIYPETEAPSQSTRLTEFGS